MQEVLIKEIVIINKRVYSKKFIDSLNKYLKTNNNYESSI